MEFAAERSRVGVSNLCDNLHLPFRESPEDIAG